MQYKDQQTPENFKASREIEAENLSRNEEPKENTALPEISVIETYGLVMKIQKYPIKVQKSILSYLDTCIQEADEESIKLLDELAVPDFLLYLLTSIQEFELIFLILECINTWTSVTKCSHELFFNSSNIKIFLNLATMSKKNFDIDFRIIQHSCQILREGICNDPDYIFKELDPTKVFNSIANCFITDTRVEVRSNLLGLVNSLLLIEFPFELEQLDGVTRILSLMPDYVETPYFSELIKCSLNFCIIGPFFALNFVSNIDVTCMFSLVEEANQIEKIWLYAIFKFFLLSEITQVVLPCFNWKWIEDDFESGSEEEILQAINLVEVLIKVDTTKLYDNNFKVLQYILVFLSHSVFKVQEEAMHVLSIIINLGDESVCQYILDNGFIQLSSQFLMVDSYYLVANLIKLFHRIALYANEIQNVSIMEDLMSNDVFTYIDQCRSHPEENISIEAQAFFEDETIKSYLQSIEN